MNNETLNGDGSRERGRQGPGKSRRDRWSWTVNNVLACVAEPPHLICLIPVNDLFSTIRRDLQGNTRRKRVSHASDLTSPERNRLRQYRDSRPAVCGPDPGLGHPAWESWIVGMCTVKTNYPPRRFTGLSKGPSHTALQCLLGLRRATRQRNAYSNYVSLPPPTSATGLY